MLRRILNPCSPDFGLVMVSSVARKTIVAIAASILYASCGNAYSGGSGEYIEHSQIVSEHIQDLLVQLREEKQMKRLNRGCPQDRRNLSLAMA
ncbi:hypothetical protein OBBRIDRAFT_789689 [Obba rivulosa]|uniref:Uncharacterized protein n=1 Tax=Obba rivulosa TaxID=1052685 RepID=A0A8E2DQJ6_9APHY|nr:hypothetical protein OBBRIDRAFT_789689 [Obba rivulosa]